MYFVDVIYKSLSHAALKMISAHQGFQGARFVEFEPCVDSCISECIHTYIDLNIFFNTFVTF